MKRTIIASILGLAACAGVSKSYAQGNLIFVNYNLSSTPTYSAPVTYGGQVVDSSFSAQLLYSSTGQAGTFNPIAGAVSTFYGSSLGDIADGGGWFPAVSVTVPTYPAAGGSAAYFEVYAYNTASVGGQAAGTITGTSAVVQFSNLATSVNLHLAGDLFNDNADCAVGLTGFSVSVVPEPATLAVLGLGAAGLVALRRRKA